MLRDLGSEGLGTTLLIWLVAQPPWVSTVVFIGLVVWSAYQLRQLPAPLPSPEPTFVPPHTPVPHYLGTGGKGGAGGSPTATGNGNILIGGQGGRGGAGWSGDAGAGGGGEMQGDNALMIGGNGGHAATWDGQGGQPARSPMYGIGPTMMWKYGQGGRGASDPEHLRRIPLLSRIHQEYHADFPDDMPWINAGVEKVPLTWVNARLEETGEAWRCTERHGLFKLPALVPSAHATRPAEEGPSAST